MHIIMGAAYNYDESKKNAAEVTYWEYEALSSASQREVCNRSSTDYSCQVPVEPLPGSSQIFQGWKNAQPVALLKISACS